MVASSGSGNGSGHLDPNRVSDLLHRNPKELLRYLDSIPGASQDPHCQRLIELAMEAYGCGRGSGENAMLLNLNRQALFHATTSRLCAPDMEISALKFTPIADLLDGQNTETRNSSSSSGRMSRNGPVIFEESSAFDSGTHSSAPVALDTNSALVMIEETSAFNSGTPASAYVIPEDHLHLGQNTETHNSSSSSGRMLRNGPVIFEETSAFDSETHSSAPVALDTNSALVMIEETSAFNSGTPASAYVISEDYFQLGQNIETRNSSSSSGRMLRNGPENFPTAMSNPGFASLITSHCREGAKYGQIVASDIGVCVSSMGMNLLELKEEFMETESFLKYVSDYRVKGPTYAARALAKPLKLSKSLSKIIGGTGSGLAYAERALSSLGLCLQKMHPEAQTGGYVRVTEVITVKTVEEANAVIEE